MGWVSGLRGVKRMILGCLALSALSLQGAWARDIQVINIEESRYAYHGPITPFTAKKILGLPKGAYLELSGPGGMTIYAFETGQAIAEREIRVHAVDCYSSCALAAAHGSKDNVTGKGYFHLSHLPPMFKDTWLEGRARQTGRPIGELRDEMLATLADYNEAQRVYIRAHGGADKIDEFNQTSAEVFVEIDFGLPVETLPLLEVSTR